MTSADETTRRDTIAARTLRALQVTRADGSVAAPEAAPEDDESAESPADIEDLNLAPPVAPAPAKPVVAPMSKPVARPQSTTAARRPRRLVTALAVAAVIALAFAAVSGVVWWRSGHNSTRTAAIDRDTVLFQARLDAAALNTLDHKHAQAAVAKWLSVSTGEVAKDYQQYRTQATQLIEQAGTDTRAVVLDAAVATLDPAKGTATVLLSMNVTKTPAKGAASTSRNRYLATMTRVGSQWKISDLTTVAVALQ